MPIPFLSSIGLNKNEVQDFKVFNLASDPTLTASGDLGYLWLNTTNAGAVIPTLKWWDGTNVRSLIDSTNIGSFTSGLATDLAGGGAGQIVYQDAVNDTKFLAAGTSGQVLSSNAANAPSWVNQSSLSAGTAANISGGLAGQLLYQSALATTAKLTIGTAGQALVVNAGATAPQWVDQSSFSVGSATNKTGGTVGDILVQSGSGATSFLNVGTNGQVITSNGTSPQYVNQSTLSVGSATTSGTATNIAGGAANRIPYQTAAGTTAFITDAANSILTTNASSVPGLTASISVTVGKAVDIALGAAGDLLYQSASNDTSFLNIGTNGQVLTSSGSAPQWSNQSSLSVGSATTAGSVTNALTAGSYLTSTGTFNGSAARTFAVDATDANTASKVVARDANGNFSAGTITATTVTGLSAPSAGSDAANRNYVDSVAQGLDVKASCLVATTGDITLSSPGAISIDNIPSTSFTSGTTRILVRAQSTASQNGIYIWNGPSSAMTRSADADTWDELVSAFTFIEKGDTLRDTGWVCTVDAGGTLGTTAITWSQFSGAGSYTAGRGMVLDGTAFNFAQSTNYTADTIPYASGATTIGFIGAGTADQVLRVPGAGGTPAFGAIDLSKSAAVTGTLAVGNGGTGITSLGAGIAAFLGTPTSANLATAVTDETGTGALVFANSPTLAGTPLSTTATADTNTTQIATTAYVIGQASATTPAALGTAAVGTSLKYARADHVHALPTIDLSNGVTGTLPVANGGTGAATFTAGRVLFGNGTSALNTSANLFWDNSNNRLGIGTATPSVALDVNGSAYFRASSAILGAGTPFEWISTYPNRTQAYQSSGNDFEINNISSGGFRLYLNSTERLRIASDGVCTWSNVGGVAGTAMTLNGTGLGIGTATISERLTVSGNVLATDSAGTYPRFISTVGAKSWEIGYRSGTTNYELREDGTTRLVVANGGNVGIGTTTPAATLDVNGASTLRGNITVASGATSYGTLFITSSLIELQANSNATNGLRFKTTSATPITLFTNDAERLRIDSSGNVGIGTATPSQKLDVSGAVNSVQARFGNVAGRGLEIGTSLVAGTNDAGSILNAKGATSGTLIFQTDSTERLRIKSTGQVNFVGLASDPAGAAGDVYYNSGSNVFKVYDTGWKTLPRKYVVQLSDGSVTVAGNAYTLTHNFASKDVTISIRRTTDDAVVLADVTMPTTNTATVTFASAITAANYYVTVIG